MTSTWPSQSQILAETLAMIDSTDSKPSNQKDMAWVVLEQLREVSLLLTDIGTKLEVLSQVLWVKDSQELS